MIPVQQSSFTIPAGGSFPLQCNGRYFRIQSATGSLKVVGDSFGNMGSVGVGQGLHLREQDPVFQRLTFIDTSGAPNIVSVVIADADFVDNSLLGTVSVVDGEKSRTLAGAQFGGSATSGSAVGNTPKVQLWNPVGSGKNLIVRSALASGAAAAVNTLYHGMTATQLATAGVAPSIAASKLIGGAAGVGLVRTEDSLPAAIAVSAYLTQATFPANVTQLLQLPIFGAIVVPPGKGLIATCSQTNVFLSAAWEWFEENQ